MRKLILFLMNNMITNRILIAFGKDDLIKKYSANWSKTKLDKDKSLQENVGFSHEKEVQQSIDAVHQKIQEVYQSYCSSEGSVLDIGCGVGLYLQDFPDGTPLAGSDLSEDFINKGKELLPQADLRLGDFMELSFNDPFKMIFSVSVMQYIPPSKILRFFDKIYANLETGGIMMIQYPHALSNRDCYYPDLSYVQYSPQKISRCASRSGFKILSHVHSYDARDLNFKFDTKRYDPDQSKSFRNGAFIICQKGD